jgi:NAD(P)-dependent dehydrogenase (short-subunit alcohol dehydrogenase family)
MENRESVVVVTGASSGIGNACATFLAKKGNRVYGTCRDPASYLRNADEFFEMLPMDIADGASVLKAAEKIISLAGKVDSLICCAGSGLLGSVEDSSLDEAQALMNVNYFGTLRTIKAFLPRMREAGRGRILIVGALEGIAATPYQGAYSASEFALEALAESLRIEVASFGIEVGIIELGSFRTAFGQKRLLAAAATGSSPYKAKQEAALGILSRDEATGSLPLVAARAIFSALSARRLPSRKTAGTLARRILAFSKRILPSGLFERRLRVYYRLWK